MEVRRKYERRRLLRVIIYATMFILIMTIAENSSAYEWAYLLIGAIILAIIDSWVTAALKLNELKNEMKKSDKGIKKK